MPDESQNAVTNGSWAPGVGRTYIPGRSSCTTPGCSAIPAVSSSFNASWADSWINILGVVTQATLNVNYDRDGNWIGAVANESGWIA